MKRQISFPAGLGFAAFLGACNSAPDPTSSAVLITAPPFQWGTTCTQHQTSAFDGSVATADVQVCDDGLDCGNEPSDSSSVPLGDETYSNDSYNSDPQFFEGTCENAKNQTPVSCSQRQPQNDCDVCQYANCCPYVALCEDDPNCTAVDDCEDTCTDDTCENACLTNGDLTAVANWEAAISCIQSSCTTACGGG